MICPICQKAGIRDESLNCPQCNSDLSQLQLIKQLENKFNNWKKVKSFILYGLSIIILALIGIILYLKINYTDTLIPNSNVVNNTDSIEYYRYKYLSVSKEVESLKSVDSAKVYINYKVKKGDTLSKIALMFYNEVKMINKIASDNGLKDMNCITTNQILKIEFNN